MSVLILLYFGLLYPEVTAQADFGMHLPMYYTNSCDDKGGRALTCAEGHVIRINDVRCMPYNKTCNEKDRIKIARLCDGLQTCSYIDLRRQLYFHCKDPNTQVVTSFQCIPADSKPLCRTNVCGDVGRDVRCGRGKVFHLMTAKCFNGERECNSDVYMAIFRTCEGKRSCKLADLKRNLLPGFCDGTYSQRNNMFMDYICIDENVINEKCTDEFLILKPRFGILRSPHFPHNPQGLQVGCYWAIYTNQSRNESVNVTIHLSYAKEGKEQCDSKFLTVQYKSCEKRTLQTNTLCDAGRVNTVIISCGTVFVMHRPYIAGEDKGNRFLVSYSVKRSGSTIEPYENYAHRCEKRYQVTPSTMAPVTEGAISTAYFNPSATTKSKITDTDVILNDSSIPLPEDEPEQVKEDDGPPSGDPWRLVTLLRVVVVNIFLGLLIIALIMALAFVCYRYRTIGKEKKRNATKSDTATTLDEKNSTEMQLLPSDDEKTPNSYSHRDGQHVAACEAEREPLQEVTSFSVVSPYETTIFHYNRDTHDPNDPNDETLLYDTETGISSFFPTLQGLGDSSKNQNSESAYSSLDAGDEGIQATEYLEISDTYSKPDCSKQLTKVPNNIYLNRKHIPSSKDSTPTTDSASVPNHYEINNEQYATVNRASSPEHRKVPPQPPKRCNHNDKGSNCCGTSPQITHIHPVQEDHHGECGSPSTMHMIPEHDCLLHKIPPPPPPAKLPPDLVLQGNWTSRTLPEYHSRSLDHKDSPKQRKMHESYRY